MTEYVDFCVYGGNMEKLKKMWQSFAEKNPKIAEWVREGGLFFLVSTLITVLKMILLVFLPDMLSFLGDHSFGFPGIPLTIFGVPFTWNILGYEHEDGGFAYFVAYLVIMFVGEVINFFIQRKYVFRSNGNIAYQGMWYFLAFIIITCIVNSINCYWKALAQLYFNNVIEAIVTTVVSGGISMVVFFFVNKIVFKEKKTEPESATESQTPEG